MRIAVSSDEKEVESEISMVSGRAKYYLIFEDNKLVKTLSNPFRIGGGGAGFGVAQMLEDENVDLVISGKIGENMKRALDDRKMKYKEISGNIKEVISNE